MLNFNLEQTGVKSNQYLADPLSGTKGAIVLSDWVENLILKDA